MTEAEQERAAVVNHLMRGAMAMAEYHMQASEPWLLAAWCGAYYSAAVEISRGQHLKRGDDD